jgi:hypothetical protein
MEVSMSLIEQNRMLVILHKNGVSRKNIDTIMTDLNESDIFEDYLDEIQDDEDWRLLEEESMILFGGADARTKIEEIRKIKNKKEELEKSQLTQYYKEQSIRVHDKIEELSKSGKIKPNDNRGKKTKKDKKYQDVNIRYGRTPLHEAISMKSIKLVEKYIKSGEFLEIIDNNGHTPLEMAFYENYTEALELFKFYENRKKVG